MVAQGHQVASGRAFDSPYPHGSILMQKPFFKLGGLDLDAYYSATINLDIRPYKFSFIKPDYHFSKLAWTDGVVEDFSFIDGEITHKARHYSGVIYYPHPETKPAHIHDASTLEVIAPLIRGLQYGEKVKLTFDANKLKLARVD